MLCCSLAPPTSGSPAMNRAITSRIPPSAPGFTYRGSGSAPHPGTALVTGFLLGSHSLPNARSERAADQHGGALNSSKTSGELIPRCCSSLMNTG